MICTECGKTISEQNKYEAITFEHRGEKKHVCHVCQDDTKVELWEAYREKEIECQKLSKPILTCPPYSEYRPALGQIKWYIHIVLSQNSRFQEHTLTGDTKREVEEKLSNLRKELDGVA